MRPRKTVSDLVEEAFRNALSDLGPADLRVVHLAVSQAVDLEAEGRGVDAEILLLGLLRIIEDDDPYPPVPDPARAIS